MRVREGNYAYSEEVNENVVIDLDNEGKILAIEILDASSTLGKESLEKTLKAEGAVIR
ncbi:MAG: DUF2283 domain-containing protein [Aigarchaeota archaeon]|nr:DUF2283 domain-containing protein [Candidatus Pelearchaeum maunauluense]